MVPTREVAIHWCFNDEKFGAPMMVVTRVVDAMLRSRSRLHRGSHVEVQYDLVSFGIPIASLPFNADGDMKRKDFHSNFLKMLRRREERLRDGTLDPNEPVIMLPSNKDVLLGRGKPVRTHPGNLRLGFLVEERLQGYFQGKRPEKIAIANQIYFTMIQDGSRFLKQNDDGIHVVVDEATAISKIEHFFRNRKPFVPSKKCIGEGCMNKRPVDLPG